VFVTSNNVVMASNNWYLCLSNNVSSLTLPTSNVSTGDIIKITVNSTTLNAESSIVLNGTVYGEGISGWGQIGSSQDPYEIDIPETLTLIYQAAGNGVTARWNLVESNRL